MSTDVTAQARALAVIEQWKHDHTLLHDAEPHKGWWCVNEKELVNELAVILLQAQRKGLEEAAILVEQECISEVVPDREDFTDEERLHNRGLIDAAAKIRQRAKESGT